MLYSSLTIVRMIKCRRFSWAGNVAIMEYGAFNIVTDKPHMTETFKRPKLSREYNITININTYSYVSIE